MQILELVWRRPSLVALEILWRWSFGIPLLTVLVWTGARIWVESESKLEATGVFGFSLQYAWQGALQVSDAIDVLKPPVLHAAVWILPLAIALWALASGLGRNAVMRRYRPETPRRPGAMIALQLLRAVALVATYVVWFVAVRGAANFTLAQGTSGTQAEPNLVLYCALVIVFSLGIFTVWALLSWVFSIAPLLVLLENLGIGASLIRSARLGPLRGKLVEINLVMGIAKLGLIVLAMVFSATPLPFADAVGGGTLYAWWALVTVLYLVASDFFQVARVVAFTELWGLVVHAGTPSAGLPVEVGTPSAGLPVQVGTPSAGLAVQAGAPSAQIQAD